MECSTLARVSSRREEKDRAKQERLARERELDRLARRRRLVRAAGAGLLAVAAVAAVVIIAATSGGRSGAGKPEKPGAVLLASARAAGCELHSYSNLGQEHTPSNVAYKTNPPTSGPHNPVPADDGIYDAGGSPPVGKTVHALEHGRVEVQWKPGLPPGDVAQLQRAVFSQNAGRHALLFQNQTAMPYAVAATAWRQLIGCPRFSPGALAALRDFRARYTDKAPELIP